MSTPKKMINQPKHRAPYSGEFPFGAVCDCYGQPGRCPRHQPETYADAYARHATDTIPYPAVIRQSNREV